MSSPTPASRSKTRYSPTTVRQSTNYGTPQPPNHSLTRTLRTRLPVPTAKPQNDRRKPLRHTLHHQTRLPHFHQTKRLRRTLTIPKRHHPHSHRLRSRFPRLSARRPVPKHQMGDPRDNARPPPHGALSPQSRQYDLTLVRCTLPSARSINFHLI
jgi:hypothetical protein